MNRRNISTAVSLAEAPKPSDNVSEAFSAIEARRKLEIAIEDQKSKAEVAEIEFAKSFARGLQIVAVVDADAAVQKDGERKAAQERAQLRVDALGRILETINKLIDGLKDECPDAVNSALTRKVATLEQSRSEKESIEKDLADQIRKLKSEIGKLPKSAAKKTA